LSPDRGFCDRNDYFLCGNRGTFSVEIVINSSGLTIRIILSDFARSNNPYTQNEKHETYTGRNHHPFRHHLCILQPQRNTGPGRKSSLLALPRYAIIHIFIKLRFRANSNFEPPAVLADGFFIFLIFGQE
jgi:hypothetical protein